MQEPQRSKVLSVGVRLRKGGGGRILTALALGTLLAGCPPTSSQPCDTDADCPDGRCRFGACGPICEEDLDCGSRQVCVDGSCAPRPECQEDEDCAAGFACEEGQCRCTGDDACALNQVCQEGVCQVREGCQEDDDCEGGQRCEVTQGLCLPPCGGPADCAPGMDPQLAFALYQCLQGTCHRRCLDDLTCGPGLICADGLCQAADCATFADCPKGQYCTSATFGRCVAYELCTSSAQCPEHHQCRAFDPLTCPPGFDCGQTLCLELPRCLVDADCEGGLPGQPDGPAYCHAYHCQPTLACQSAATCAAGQACVGGLCVPGGCRGHADCEAGQACVGGTCRTQPAAVNISALALTPEVAHLVVGQEVTFKLVGYELDGSSFPLGAASFAVFDQAGQPSSAATVDPQGRLLAAQPGVVEVRASLQGAAVNPVTATVYVHAPLTQGRRVTVVDASTLLPLAGAVVRGCDGPPATGACPTPLDVTTDARGEALFPGFAQAEADFSVASPQLRADALPLYERASVAGAGAQDLLLPLWPNPVQAAAGFNGSLSFNQVHSDGNYWMGFTVLSVIDPSSSRPLDLLGEPFQVPLPNLPQRVPVPGSVVLYTSPGLGIPNPVKERSLGLCEPGRHNATAFAGRTTSSQLLDVRSTEVFSYAGALDYGLVPFFRYPSLPRVWDAADVDGDGRCADPQACPMGPERVPDYFQFTPLQVTPRHVQERRTEVDFPELPPPLDAVVVAAVEAAPESGLTLLGFSSAAAGPPEGTGLRRVDPLVVRSGAPLGGVEVGLPGLWVTALSAGDGAAASGRLLTGPLLPTRAVVPPFLPLPEGGVLTPQDRTFSPGQPAWNIAVSSGGQLARVDAVGTQVRHRIYFAAAGSQAQVRLPDPAPAPFPDPVEAATPRMAVTLFDLVGALGPMDALDLGGPGLTDPALMMDGYSRWESQ